MTNRVFRDGVLLTESVSPPAAPRREMSEAEKAHWQTQAALLDPDAYEYAWGNNWTRTVPVGACWWAVNLWFVRTTDGANYQHQRLADTAAAVPLPAGTVLRCDASHAGFAYVCKPETVIAADLRYQYDPKELYFSRKLALQTMQQREISVSIPLGSAQGVQATTPWPAGVTRGIIVAVSVYDAAWVTMTNAFGGINLLHEISDDHGMRLARGVTLPFRTSDFTGLKIRSASVRGEFTGESSLAGFGFARYVSIPDGW